MATSLRAGAVPAPAGGVASSALAPLLSARPSRPLAAAAPTRPCARGLAGGPGSASPAPRAAPRAWALRGGAAVAGGRQGARRARGAGAAPPLASASASVSTGAAGAAPLAGVARPLSASASARVLGAILLGAHAAREIAVCQARGGVARAATDAGARAAGGEALSPSSSASPAAAFALSVANAPGLGYARSSSASPAGLGCARSAVPPRGLGFARSSSAASASSVGGRRASRALRAVAARALAPGSRVGFGSAPLSSVAGFPSPSGRRLCPVARSSNPLATCTMDDWNDASVEILNDEDPRATVLVVRGRTNASHVARMTSLLADMGLSIASAAINGERDGESCDVFHVTRLDGSKVPEDDWPALRGSILTLITEPEGAEAGGGPGAAWVPSPPSGGQAKPETGSGGAPAPARPAVHASEADAAELERAAADMAAAAASLVNLERDLYTAASREGADRDEGRIATLAAARAQAEASLERRMTAVEAVLAARRAAQQAAAAQAAAAAAAAGMPTPVPTVPGAPSPAAVSPAPPQVPDLFKPPPPAGGPASGDGREIILQGFNWESCKSAWWDALAGLAPEISEVGFSAVWLPPPSDAVSQQGYLPLDYYNLNSKYGSEESLRGLIAALHDNGVKAICDVVINHRCANHQGPDGKWNRFGGRLQWDASHICRNNPVFGGTGAWKQEEDYPAAPNIDHSQERIRRDLTDWLRWLRTSIGYDGWRFDFVKGYAGKWVREYVDATVPEIAFGEFWDTCAYADGVLEYNQDAHRQRTVDWCDATGGTTAAFDFTTKGILQEAIGRREYWRLIDPQGRAPGVMGMWPSRAITFLENHDTGSTLQHWPFPWDHAHEGYAYILTHPATPCVFYDHYVFDQGLRKSIKELVAVRRKYKISVRSKLTVLAAYADVYAAVVDDAVVVKIGPADWSPDKAASVLGGGEWQLQSSGFQYAVWGRPT